MCLHKSKHMIKCRFDVAIFSLVRNKDNIRLDGRQLRQCINKDETLSPLHTTLFFILSLLTTHNKNTWNNYRGIILVIANIFKHFEIGSLSDASQNNDTMFSVKIIRIADCVYLLHAIIQDIKTTALFLVFRWLLILLWGMRYELN